MNRSSHGVIGQYEKLYRSSVNSPPNKYYYNDSYMNNRFAPPSQLHTIIMYISQQDIVVTCLVLFHQFPCNVKLNTPN